MQQSGGRIRRLTNVETLSVALVTRGANKKRVALTKTQGGKDMTTTELLAQIIQKGDMPMSDDEINKLCQESGLDEQGTEAFKALVKIGQSFSDNEAFGTLVKDKYAGLLGLSSAAPGTQPGQEPAKTEPAKPGAPAAAAQPPAKPATEQTTTPPSDDGKDKEEPEMTQKTADEVKKAEDMKVALEKAEKSAADATAKLGAFEEVMKTQKDTITKMQDDLTKERDERNLAEWVTKSEKDLAFVPNKTAAELGAMFHKLEKTAGKEAAQAQYDVSKSMSDALSKSELFKTSGTIVRGNGTVTKGAYALLEEKAASLIEKADTGKSEAIRKAAAMAKAIEQNPDLYQAYLAENAAQTGKR